ncbi:hypothetical protein ACFYWS_36110 [Streptomyces sp. NPDC002795]|uniref:hypothetical protein n=1 Tax=Streptomyces sp. NPDC002795 TaxID=3364665 RepID=UPI00367E54C8
MHAASSGSQGVQLPLADGAFEDPATRATWTRTRRKVRVRLTLWTVFWVGSFIAVSLLDEFRNLLGPVGAVVFLVYLVYLCQLYLKRTTGARGSWPFPAGGEPHGSEEGIKPPTQPEPKGKLLTMSADNSNPATMRLSGDKFEPRRQERGPAAAELARQPGLDSGKWPKPRFT